MLKSDPTLSNTSRCRNSESWIGISLLIAAGTIAGCGGGVLLRYLDLMPEECTTDPDLKEEKSESESSKLPRDLIRPTL